MSNSLLKMLFEGGFMKQSKDYKEIYLAGGCFWGVQMYFDCIQGVIHTDVGYANGTTENPSYEEVCRGDTGHAETVHIIYDPKQVSLKFLLDMYFDIIDPTSVNRQGGDIGPQYRTGIYYVDPADEEVIRKAIDNLQKSYDKPIVVEVMPLKNYYLAEEYHQKYLVKNPNGYCHIGAEKFEKAKKARDNTIKG